MRQYQAHWLTIKSTGTCLILNLPQDRHISVSKMVRKESKRDTRFNQDVMSKGKRFYLSSASLGTSLRISIVWTA